MCMFPQSSYISVSHDAKFEIQILHFFKKSKTVLSTEEPHGGGSVFPGSTT